MPQFGTLFGVSEGKTLNVNSKIVLKRLVLLYQVAKAHIKQFLHVPLNVLHAASRADMEQRGRTEVANTPDLKMLLPFVPKCWLTLASLAIQLGVGAFRGLGCVSFVAGMGRFSIVDGSEDSDP